MLVNGADGIGTGWSTHIPAHNPREIVANLKAMMLGEKGWAMNPWYKGFEGTIERGDNKGFVVTGCYQIINDSLLRITELPIGKWTRDYKTFLEELA